MDAIAGLSHWLDQITLRLEPQQRKELMRKLAQGLRLRHKDRINQQRDSDGSRFIPRKRDQIGNIKRRGALFQNITKQLKTEYSADQASVGFGSRTATVGSVHQDGKTIRPSKHAKPTTYPVRKLAGFGQEDEKWIMSEIAKYLNS